ncbi:MAG: multiheme c-type cytochrome [Planctomycetota bacterium]
MKTSTFVILSFTGLIFLAASLIWLPPGPQHPEPPQELPQVPTQPARGTQVDVPLDSPNIPAPLAMVDAPKTVKTKSAPQNDGGTHVDVSGGEKAAETQTPLEFLEWPKPPLAILASGEQHGYFEPCGCTANQLGGMSRRAGFVDKLISMGWTVRGVDVGGLSRRTGPQAQMKFDTIVKALRQLQYVAVALGPEELRLDPAYLMSYDTTSGDIPMAFLGANLTFFGSKDVGIPQNYTTVEHNGVKVGITSIMSDTIRRSVIPERSETENANADLTWADPALVLKEVLTKLDEEKVTFRILLSQATLEESRKLAVDYPQFDMIVTANGFGEGERQPEMIGKVRLLQVGEKGKQVGLIGLYPDDRENPVRFELITLSGDRFPDSDAMTMLMQDYQGQLRDQSTVTAEPAIAHPSGAKFVGASKCGECHTKAFEIWKGTAHAHAFESLDPANARDGHDRLHGVLRTFDPECLACHVTGWDPKEYARYDSGFLNEELAADDNEKSLHSLLAGNQCENCHGPGSQHVELIEAGSNEAAAKLMKVTLEQADTVTCRKCHDLDNSPDFQFEAYWEQVKHYGKD